MTNNILSMTSQTSCPQLRGACLLQGTHLVFLHRNGTLVSRSDETPRGPCADVGLRMTCSASGRVKSKVCKCCLSEEKTTKIKQAAGSAATAPQ